MSVWLLVQVFVNLCFLLALFVLWSRLKRPPQDDPRLSRGLQLLQSKISVLEDLSDRTEIQVKQLNALLDEKAKQMRKAVLSGDNTILQIQQSMQKSLKVAEIFQDRIPHEEIIERQNTVKYVKAARMAHEGVPLEEIAAEVDLPIAEIEFIAKVNKDQLMFKEELLPAWAMNEEAFRDHEDDTESLEKIGREFRQAVESFEEKERLRKEEEIRAQEPSQLAQVTSRMTQQVTEKIKEHTEDFVEKATVKAKNFTEDVLKKNFADVAEEKSATNVSETQGPLVDDGSKVQPAVPRQPKFQSSVKVSDEPLIKKVQFPRIDVNKNLG